MRLPVLILAGGSVGLTAYVLAFGLAAVICFASLGRARQITDIETRRGLIALVATSGAWATAHVLFLLVPTPILKRAVYQVGLIIGVSTIGPWLYFCSAYTGRTLHRSRPLKRLAVMGFLMIVVVKLTNPFHHLYFRAEFVTTPFPHLAVQNGVFHWLTMGAMYALAAVGYFMLLELFWQIDHEATPFVGLIGLTALPAGLDLVGRASPRLLDITYEPLGVAAFAVGVLFVYFTEFQAIQFAGEYDDPVIVLDDENRIRDYNAEAQSVFSTLARGEQISAVVPELSKSIETEEAVIEIDRVGGMRYYQMSASSFTTDQTRLGQTITLTDVTDREQYRRELERQNERLDQFASMISHDLRNPLNVAQARVSMALEAGDIEELRPAKTALDRIETLIDEVLTLARQGQPIGETEEVELRALVEDCWTVVDTTDATLTVESDLSFIADADRVQQLFENLVRNAIDHGRAPVTIRVGALDEEVGFYVADDGPGIPADERETVFEAGYSTGEEGIGFGLAIVEEIVGAHGWEMAITESWAGGARFEIRNVDTLDSG